MFYSLPLSCEFGLYNKILCIANYTNNKLANLNLTVSSLLQLKFYIYSLAIISYRFNNF